jgi:hypothetical protein
MPSSREVTPSRETDQAHEGQSSVREGKRKWSPGRDATERGSPPPEQERLTKLARTAFEGNQEQEKDEATLVLDNIQTDTLKKLSRAITDTVYRVYKNDDIKKREMKNLAKDVNTIISKRTGDDARKIMNNLLAEVPRIPTASTGIAKFLSEVEQIKQNNSEQAEEG